MSEVPESLKFIQNYLLRAKEVETKDPIISYYCRFYAAKAAIEKIQDGTSKNKEAEVFVLGLMDQLDKEKLALAENEAIKNETIGYAHVENFALKIFLNADNADRNGQATKITAKTFLASSIFLEVLKGFGDGELEPEIVQKIKYAKFKAADIMKAFKEGKQPTPGPPGGDEYMNASSPASPSAPPSTSVSSNTTAPTGAAPSNPETSFPEKKNIPVYKAPAAAAPVNFSALNMSDGEDLDDEMVGYSEEDRKSISAAGKHAKFAMSALLYDDIPTAMKNLQLAMDLLKPIKIIEDLISPRTKFFNMTLPFLQDDFQLLQRPKNKYYSSLINGIPMSYSYRKRVDEQHEADYVLIMLPGNPGVPAFYDIFLERIHQEFPHIDIFCLSYVEMHLDVKGLVGQICTFFDTLEESYSKRVNFIVAAHSLGSYLTIQLLKKRPNANIVKVISLFPSMTRMATTPRGRQVAPITSLIPRTILSCGVFALSLLPKLILKQIAVLLHPEHTAESIVEHLLNKDAALSALYLGNDEMKVIADLEKEILIKNQHKWHIYFGEGDGWCPPDHIEEITATASNIEYVLCQEGHDHAFVISSSVPIAEKVIDWLRPKLSDL